MANNKLSRKDRQELYGRMSKYFEDISKLVVAGVVIAAIMKEPIGIWWLLGCGGTTAVFFLYLAWQYFIRSKR